MSKLTVTAAPHIHSGASTNRIMLDVIVALLPVTIASVVIFGLQSLVIIAACVIRYMALYDIFRSLDPGNAVLYLVLSILFSPTEPFFLFFNREKDLGMPPRKQQPVYEQQDYTYESVDNTEYL